MSFLTIFKVALRSLGRNPIRSFLSCLGIGIGIVAVILAMAIGEGAKTMMVKEISSMGNNLMMVFPERRNHGPVSGGMGQGQTMTAGDAEAIKRELGHLVQGVSPQVRTTVQMMYGAKNWSGNVQGVATDVLNISNWTVTDGRFFTDDETRLAARVCCIGTTVRSNLFVEDEDPVGKVIRLKNMTFKVIGVLGRHRLALPHSARHRPAVAPLGKHHHEVVAHRRDLLDHHRLRTLANRHREDDGRDADADP